MELDKNEWLSVKYNLDLAFPNVSEIGSSAKGVPVECQQQFRREWDKRNIVWEFQVAVDFRSEVGQVDFAVYKEVKKTK